MPLTIEYLAGLTSDIIPLIVVGVIVLSVVAILVVITMRVRRRGGSPTTIGLGATHEFLNKDRRKAVEVIVNVKAVRRLGSQTSGAPDNPAEEDRPPSS